ncbi:ParB/RepB/Spo0J family partition protein [Schaedlerella arabinosiphila]|uniref:ParB/RepB/Spo0J family partition protein n=1 Tax=Schaedlerella arabinosiphila TaxID=2044587 RepID=UPI002557DB8B|nr:DUF3850 domain-containing protein [Schaedlerella arabinosiphila]
MATGFTVMDALNKNSKAGIKETPKARFRTKDISIYKMYRNDRNFYSLEAIEELAGDILTFGLKQNLELVYEPCTKGEYRIIAGERRWLALKLLVKRGYKEFEIATCKLTAPQDADEEQIEIIIANAYRSKCIGEIVEEEKRLKESLEKMKTAGKQIKGYDLTSGRLRDVIASMLHMSKTKVAQIDSVNNNLIPEFKEELKKERLTFSAAYELSGMSTEMQQEAMEQFRESGELSHKTVKKMKEDKAAGQEDFKDQEHVSDSDTEKYMNPPKELEKEGESSEKIAPSGNDSHLAAGNEYQTPHPEGITSLCYSCKNYSKCNVKTGTCTKCDQYINKAEAEKTAEQRYYEEQDKIDRETRKKLREKADEERMENLPSSSKENVQRIHQIRLGVEFFKDVCSGAKPFEIRKNDRDYKTGDILEMMEFASGMHTGRSVKVLVTYILDAYTGLKDGYCIMGTSLVNKDGEALQRADINQVCADIKANGDGVTEDSEEYILIDKAVEIVRDGGTE